MEITSILIMILMIGVSLTPGGDGFTSSDCTVKPNLPCTLYVFENSVECSPISLQKNLGYLYNDSVHFWPGRASEFKVKTYHAQRSSDNRWFAGANVTFSPPADISIQSVKGFEIMRYRSDTTEPGCYIYDLSNATWTMDDIRVEYELVLYPVKKDTLYRLELYTLPKPHVDFDQYRHFNFQLPGFVPDTTIDFSFSISFNVLAAEAIIEVHFTEPLAKYNITQYSLRLKNVKANNLTKEEIISSTSHNITNVSPGTYEIQLMPYDEFFNNRSRCICKKVDGTCGTCITTITQQFTMRAPPSTTPSPTTEDTTPSLTTPTTTTAAGVVIGTPMNDNALKIALSVVGTIIGLGLAIFAVWFYRRWHGNRDLNGDDEDKKNPYLDNVSWVTNNNPVVREKLQEKKVFIVYEEDHDLHRKVVDLFGRYLQSDCHCAVMSACWRLEAIWVHQEIQKADVIIIINSEAAYNMYMSHKGQSHYVVKIGGESSPTSVPKVSEQLGINCILQKLLHENRVPYTNTVMVKFEYTAEKFVIPHISPGFNYTLMKHFTEFLCHIHGLKRCEDLAKYDLPHDVNHFYRETGRELLDEIKNAAKFEKNNQRWYSQKFGMFRSISKSSEDSYFDSGIDTDPAGCGPYSSIESPHGKYMNFEDLNSGEVRTIPPDMGRHVYDNPLMLNTDHTEVHRGQGHQLEAPDSAEFGQFDFFIPPEDNDGVSKTLSEQMMNINKFRPETYNRNHDLHILHLESGTIPYEADANAEAVSIGGESV